MNHRLAIALYWTLYSLLIIASIPLLLLIWVFDFVGDMIWYLDDRLIDFYTTHKYKLENEQAKKRQQEAAEYYKKQGYLK